MPCPRGAARVADPGLTWDGASLRFTGPVTFATVAALMARGRDILAGLPPSAAVDLSGVTRVDSAGVAMLVELWRLRAADGCSLRLESVPDDLRPLLQLYGLGELFGVEVPG
jgi:phospholipid transport system transporter-binding protein